MAKGATFKRANGNFVWRMRSARWRANGRKIRLASSTLYPLFKKWQANGKTPEVLLLRYVAGHPKCPQGFIQDFLGFCSQPRRSLSLLAAWKEFIAQRDTPAPVGYSATLRYYNSGRFRAIQQEYRKSAKALAAAKSHHTADAAFVRARYTIKGHQP